jgi:hypothetical protein
MKSVFNVTLMATTASLGLSLTAHAGLTGTYSYGGSTSPNGDGTYNLVSNSGANPYSFVNFTLDTPVTFSQLTGLDAVFTVDDGSVGAGGGSPRLVLNFSNGGDVNILLGTAPNYLDDVTSLSAYSGANLIGNNDTGRYDTSNDGLGNGNPWTTYTDALAEAGNLTVTSITFAVDGEWKTSPQEITLDSINATVPEPSTYIAGLALLFPLGLSAFRMTRKARAGTI